MEGKNIFQVYSLFYEARGCSRLTLCKVVSLDPQNTKYLSRMYIRQEFAAQSQHSSNLPHSFLAAPRFCLVSQNLLDLRHIFVRAYETTLC